MGRYVTNIAEAISQLFNAVHGGNPNQTFSVRLATLRGTSNLYFACWIWCFETFWPGHLDWSLGPDEEE
jgi:hypothetical protein